MACLPTRAFMSNMPRHFRDYNGNTIFAGTALTGNGFVGSAKYKLSDGVFVRQEASGNIVLDNNITCDETKVCSALLVSCMNWTKEKLL